MDCHIFMDRKFIRLVNGYIDDTWQQYVDEKDNLTMYFLTHAPYSTIEDSIKTMYEFLKLTKQDQDSDFLANLAYSD